MSKKEILMKWLLIPFGAFLRTKGIEWIGTNFLKILSNITMDELRISIKDIWMEFINIEIKIWVLLCFLLLAFVIVISIRIFIRHENNKRDPNYFKNPIYLREYKSGFFEGGLKWSWEYKYDKKVKGFIVDKVTPLCDLCNAPLILGTMEGECPDCSANFKYLSSITIPYQGEHRIGDVLKIKKIIRSKIERDNWE